MVGRSLLATVVLQVEGEQAGETGAVATSCQQAGDRLFENDHGAAAGYEEQLGFQCAHSVQIAPRVDRHLMDDTELLLLSFKSNEFHIFKKKSKLLEHIVVTQTQTQLETLVRNTKNLIFLTFLE